MPDSWDDANEWETPEPLDTLPQQEGEKDGSDSDSSEDSSTIIFHCADIVEPPCEAESVPAEEEIVGPTDWPSHDDEEEAPPAEEAVDPLPTPTPTSSEKEEAKPVCLIAVKFYLSAEDEIRRVALDKNDASAFDKLASSLLRMRGGSDGVFAPKYYDDEDDPVTMRTQEEFEECIRVHETFHWLDEPSVPILKLYL